MNWTACQELNVCLTNRHLSEKGIGVILDSTRSAYRLRLLTFEFRSSDKIKQFNEFFQFSSETTSLEIFKLRLGPHVSITENTVRILKQLTTLRHLKIVSSRHCIKIKEEIKVCQCRLTNPQKSNKMHRLA